MNKEEIIKDTLDRLPLNMKEVSTSVEFGNIVRYVGDLHDLLVSELGVLYEEVKKFLLGEISQEELRKNLQNGFYENGDKVDEVLKDVNESLLNPLREKLKKSTNKEEEPEEDHSKLNRSDILNEIEHPMPAVHPRVEIPKKIVLVTPVKTPVSVVQQTPQIPTNTITAIEIPPASEVVLTNKPSTAMPTISTSSLLENKLNGIVQMPKKEVLHTSPTAEQTKVAPQNPRAYSADPYREPTV